MALFVKICGICSEADARAVAEMRPDAAGFILWPRGRRYVPPADVGGWADGWPAGVLRVGVFVDATPGEVREAMAVARLDVAQLHGSETPDTMRQVGGRLWKSWSTDRGVPGPEWPAERFVLDHEQGGSGRALDWAAARPLVERCPRPVLLAGGLTPDNVEAAVAVVKPFGVDVSSGVESELRKKDLAKVRAFIQLCRTLA